MRGLNSRAGKADQHVMDLRGNSQRTRPRVLSHRTTRTVVVAVVDADDVDSDRMTTRKIHEKTTQEDHWTDQNVTERDHHVTDLRDDRRTRPQVLEHPRTQMDQRVMTTMVVMMRQDVVVDVVDLGVVERHDVEEVVSDMDHYTDFYLTCASFELHVTSPHSCMF